MAIGHWEDIQVDGDQLSAIPVFDKVDDLSKTVAAKFEAGTFNAASIGIRILETSEEKQELVPGQTRATVTKCILLEASIVDIPANMNAVRMYDAADTAHLSAGPSMVCTVPVLNSPSKPADTPKNQSKMNLKSNWKSVLAFLKVGEDKAEQTTLSPEDMDSLNAEMNRLQQENSQLKAAKEDAESKLSAATGQVDTLKSDLQKRDGEISTLKNDLQKKEDENASLQEQVKNLKNQPADAGGHLSPGKEPAAETAKDLAAFCNEADGKDYAGMTARLKEEGLI